MKSEYTPIFSKKDPEGMLMILAGFLLSIFGTLLLYKNELKSVLFTQIMDRAQSECIAVNPQNPQRSNEYKLVHISGTA